MTTTTLTQLSIPKVNTGAVGDIFLMEDGIYDHPSREAITKSIIFKAKNKGKAIIKGAPIDLTGPDIEMSGFELQFSSTEQSVLNLKGSKYKFIDNKCRFGNPISSRNDWLYVKANDGLIQGNDIGFKVGLGNMILLGASNLFGKNTKILLNWIHDQSGGTGNGAEMIRFGASSVAKEEFNVEFAGNIVENHDTSDTELITVKSSKNDIHNNTFKNCKATPTFRHGRLNKFRNNQCYGSGLRVYGRGHEVTGNLFKRNPLNQLRQIVIGNGRWAEEEANTDATYTQVRDLLFANNKIEGEDSTDNILFCFGYGDYALKPINNTVKDNKFSASKGILANTHNEASWNLNTVTGNTLWPTGSAKAGDMPKSGYVIENPNLPNPPLPPPPERTVEVRLKELEVDVEFIKTKLGI